jgi:hypothetical protein
MVEVQKIRTIRMDYAKANRLKKKEKLMLILKAERRGYTQHSDFVEQSGAGQ